MRGKRAFIPEFETLRKSEWICLNVEFKTYLQRINWCRTRSSHSELMLACTCRDRRNERQHLATCPLKLTEQITMLTMEALRPDHISNGCSCADYRWQPHHSLISTIKCCDIEKSTHEVGSERSWTPSCRRRRFEPVIRSQKLAAAHASECRWRKANNMKQWSW